MKYILSFLICLFLLEATAQENKPVEDTLEKNYFFIEGDSAVRESINLDEIVILKKLKFDSDEARREYLILRRKTRKVYPYAKLASERLVELNSRLDQIKSRRDQKKYTRIVQDYIEEQFAAELKKLTKTEGQILVKLIHRQTGVTTYSLIKNLKTGWRAFWYNTTASFFDISLKEEYDPESNREDYLIEDILQRSFQSKVLEPQPTALDFEFFELTNKWKNSTTSR